MTTIGEGTSHQPKKQKPETPLLIYLAIGSGMLVAFVFRWIDKDLSLNLLSEIIGAAFTLFVIDVLLVRSRTKRWLIVQEHIDYLIGRTINRIRDGIATRVFLFKPEFDSGMKEKQVLAEIRFQREKFLKSLSAMTPDRLATKIDPQFFTDDNYEYFQEKAEDIWKLINMKYSEYMAPSLVSLLIDLHTNIVDVCAHIRSYNKSERFPDDREYYHASGLTGTAKNMKEIIRIVIRLKEEGYSQTARIIS